MPASHDRIHQRAAPQMQRRPFVFDGVDRMDACEFFQTLYGDAADGWLSLWRRDTKATNWVRVQDGESIDQFATAAVELPFDAYFGVCLQSKRPTKGRGNEDGVGVIPAVWIDIDFASKDQTESKKKKTYPTREQAESALAKMPLPPSLVFFTGGGIHAYWLLNAPIYVDDDNRADVKSVVEGWQRRLRAILLKSCGATVDSTFDLARVMRIPGTVNVKTAESIPVEIDKNFGLQSPPPRYSLDEMRGSTETSPTTVARPKPRPKPEAVPDRVLAAVDSNPPADRLANLCEADNKFRLSWDAQRKDLESPSEYDLSLATFAHNAGWKDSEIAALLIAWTRRHHPDRIDKLLRVHSGQQDYLEMTLRSAKRKTYESAKQVQANEAIDQVIDHVETSVESGEPADRDRVLGYLTMILGIKTVGFRQTGERDEVYELIVVHEGKPKAIELGGADRIYSSPKKLVERILASTRVYVQMSGDLKKKWSGIVRALFSIVEFIEVDETTTGERVRALIHEHLTRHRGPLQVDNVKQRQQAAAELRPFIEKGRLYISGPGLRRLAAEIDKGIIGDLYVGLRSLGFVSRTIQIPVKTTSRSFWSIKSVEFGLGEDATPDLMTNGDEDDE